MATFEFTTTTPAGTGEKLAHVALSTAEQVAKVWRAVKNRRSVAKLLDWDDRMLRDIGLTSNDVRSAMSGPVREDPSLRLGLLSIERRAAIRAEARERLAVTGFSAKSDKAASLGRGSVTRFYPVLDL